jgi:hypothetical protein
VSAEALAKAGAKAVKKNKGAEAWIYSTARKSHECPALFNRCDLFFFSRNRAFLADFWQP